MEREKSLEGKSAQIECFSHGAHYPADVVSVAPPYITVTCPVAMPEGDKVLVRVRADEPLVFSASVEEQLDFGQTPRQLLRITSPIRVEDQRAAERINSGPLRCFWRYNGCNYEGVLLDVSESGAAIESPAAMEDAAVEVRIPAADVTFEAEVRNCSPSEGRGVFRVGLHYIFPDEQTIKKLIFAAAESSLLPAHKLHRIA